MCFHQVQPPQIDTKESFHELLANLRSPDRETVKSDLITEWLEIKDQLNCLATFCVPHLCDLGTLIVPDFQDSCINGASLLAYKLINISAVQRIIASDDSEISSTLLAEADGKIDDLRDGLKNRAKLISEALALQMLDDLILWFDLHDLRSHCPIQVDVPDLQDLLKTDIICGITDAHHNKFADLGLFLSHSAFGQQLRFPLIHELSISTVREEVTHYLTWRTGYNTDWGTDTKVTNKQTVTISAWYESVGVAVHILHGQEDPQKFHLPSRPLFNVVNELWHRALKIGWYAALEQQLDDINASKLPIQIIGHEFGFVIGPILAEVIKSNPQSETSKNILFPRSESDPFQRLIEAL